MFTYTTWSSYPLWKKLLIGAALLFSFAIVLSVLKVLFLQVTEPMMGGIAQDTYYGVPMMESVPQEIATLGSDSRASKAGYNIIPPQPGAATVGDDAEAYESLSYTVLYKKRDHKTVCDTVESWKPLQHVVFESSDRGDNWCYYNFKVTRDQAENVANSLKELDPATFTTDIQSLQQQVVEYDSQLNILLQKQEVLEKMLSDAVSAYDGLVALATQVEDVETLTKIIDSKLRMIESLTQQRIMLSQQIDSLARRTAELNDQIEYVRFSVRVDKYEVFDLTSLKDSWVRQLQQFVSGINSTLQELTLGVLSLVIQMLVVIVYISVIGIMILAFVKFAWRSIKTFWSKDKPQSGY